jgi:hypothetical protein
MFLPCPKTLREVLLLSQSRPPLLGRKADTKSPAYSLAATQLVGALATTYVPPCLWDTSTALQEAKSPTLHGVVFEFWRPHIGRSSRGMKVMQCDLW